MTHSYNAVRTDVLVVGGGGAACRAALEADMAGADTILAVKGAFASIGIRGAGATAGGVSDRGGVQFPGLAGIQGFDPGDIPITVEQDYANIIQLGLGMTDPKLARIMAEQSSNIIMPLLRDWSCEIVPRQWGMKSHGIPIMFGLTRMLRKGGVKIMEHTMVTHLLKEDDRIAGAMAVDEDTGEVIVIKAGAVFLGTGGMAGLFKHTTSAPECTGDGHAMGFRAGAQLMNVEFKQVFPGVIYPTTNHFSAWWFVPYVRIYNALGEEYIEKYLPEGITLDMVYQQRGSHGPFSARDRASRYFDVSTVIETKEGRANKNDALYVDLTDPRVEDPLPRPRREFFYYRGIRYLEEPIQFNICFHCNNGGIRLDENGMSTVPGLYAAGECSSGPHGANRLAGHMLGTTQVFGAIAGRHAAQITAGKKSPEIKPETIREAVDEIEHIRSMRGSDKPSEVIKDLKKIAWDNMLVHVNEQSLDLAIRGIEEIRFNRLSNLKIDSPDELIEAMELNNLVLVGEILARTTQMRKESRGDLYREDYPQRDDTHWLKVIAVNNKDGNIELSTEVIDLDWSDREGDMKGYRWG
jgi:fumarate reductase (CoM/CoB) subunit A